ncbi:hypothetical protein SAMN05216464_110199 [Mucilaginibacter pineti]|uniref:Uncharacterized protein n=1 Tax=Mucilaginibacter pineti TaxID=1391627 RepID=A0A1G7GLF0_9SPHI|nr:hypothetical protein [Mucilaginibacter pineti]SDE88924.1 hypothetical protein SAMN05216464_110199 [Mucilaginibacter pineti]
MKKIILIIAFALFNVVSFAQTVVQPKPAEKNKAISIVKSATIPDSLHMITLNNTQIKALSDAFQIAQQLLTRSPDMTAYQANEAQKSISKLGLLIGKQVEPKPKLDTLKK